MIPKVIHYCWFGKKELPRTVKKNIKSWRTYCPEYKIIEWNEENFNIDNNAFAKEAYRDEKWAFVSDYARLKVIYENGGIYLDTDVEVIKKLDRLLQNEAFVAIQRQGFVCSTGLGFGAEPHNPVIKKMLSYYSDLTFSEERAKDLACPILNDKALRSFGYKNTNDIVNLENITVYPPMYFDPLSPGYDNDLLTEKTYTIHHYYASWENGPERLKRKLINIIGQKNINSLKKRWGR